MKQKISTQISVFIFKEGTKVVAYSPAIDLSTCGDTEEQARKRFSEAANIFISEIIRMGTLEEVLTECGWKRVASKKSWKPPIYKSCEEKILIPQGV